MEGGVAIILLLVIAVVGIGIAIALYVTGGALWSKGEEQPPSEKADPVERSDVYAQHDELR